MARAVLELSEEAESAVRHGFSGVEGPETPTQRASGQGKSLSGLSGAMERYCEVVSAEA